MAYAFHIPWYATGLRGDKLEAALLDATPTALRYGATSWTLYRSQDDRYKILQIVFFENKIDFERWWDGHEMRELRTITSGWWQVPLLYVPHDLVGHGAIEPARNGNGGSTAPEPAPAAPEPAASA